MKKKLVDTLLAPDFWIKIFSLVAGAGLICVVAGQIINHKILIKFGFLLCMPLLAGGVILMIIVAPILIVANYKARKKQWPGTITKTTRNDVR